MNANRVDVGQTKQRRPPKPESFLKRLHVGRRFSLQPRSTVLPVHGDRPRRVPQQPRVGAGRLVDIERALAARVFARGEQKAETLCVKSAVGADEEMRNDKRTSASESEMDARDCGAPCGTRACQTTSQSAPPTRCAPRCVLRRVRTRAFAHRQRALAAPRQSAATAQSTFRSPYPWGRERAQWEFGAESAGAGAPADSRSPSSRASCWNWCA